MGSMAERPTLSFAARFVANWKARGLIHPLQLPPQARRLKGLQRENELLVRLVADLSLANQQLKDQGSRNALVARLATNIKSEPLS